MWDALVAVEKMFTNKAILRRGIGIGGVIVHPKVWLSGIKSVCTGLHGTLGRKYIIIEPEQGLKATVLLHLSKHLCVCILKRAKRQEIQKEAYFFKTKQRIIPALVAFLWDAKINTSNKDVKKKTWSVSESSAHGKIK